MNESDPSSRQRLVQQAFQQHFGNSPAVWCRAPGRVDLMGSHTDYNLGYVLTLPIGYDTWIAARPRTDGTVRLRSMNLEAEASFRLDRLEPDSPRHWSHYVRGVAQVLQAEGLPLTGFDGVIHSTVPISSGLSSSAALECATATVFEALGGWTLDPVRKAVLCQRAENEYVGVKCGILDQYTSCVGRAGCALLLDCRDRSNRPVPLPDGVAVVIGDTKSRRELAGTEYGERRAQCEEGARRLGVTALREISLEAVHARAKELPPLVAKRCRFIVEENDRVLQLATALANDDRSAMRTLAAASFQGACELYEIGAPSMQAMMRAMRAAPGIIGARQAGAGFGGCLVALVERDQADAFANFVTDAYCQATQMQPLVSAVEAAAGAGLVSAG